MLVQSKDEMPRHRGAVQELKRRVSDKNRRSKVQAGRRAKVSAVNRKVESTLDQAEGVLGSKIVDGVRDDIKKAKKRAVSKVDGAVAEGRRRVAKKKAEILKKRQVELADACQYLDEFKYHMGKADIGLKKLKTVVAKRRADKRPELNKLLKDADLAGFKGPVERILKKFKSLNIPCSKRYASPAVVARLAAMRRNVKKAASGFSGICDNVIESLAVGGRLMKLFGEALKSPGLKLLLAGVAALGSGAAAGSGSAGVAAAPAGVASGVGTLGILSFIQANKGEIISKSKAAKRVLLRLCKMAKQVGA